tara:strand:- start:86 stop:1183 length:1098 start_codon:yes stop_codon:yes gene_type:complete
MPSRILKDRFEFSVIFVLLISILFTGLNGFIAFFLFFIFSRINIGRDPEIKHGLSSGKSRLGGIAIAVSIIFGCCSHLLIQDHFSMSFLLSELDKIIILSFLIGFIGLIEDFRQNLSSTFRLISMLSLVAISLYFSPELIPSDLSIFRYLNLNDSNIVIYLFVIIMVCGFINAGNIADGANGLLPTIFLGYFIVAYSLDNSVFNFSVVISLIAFIVFNVLTGRIFLGDFGAYSLSALVAFKSLEFYSNYEISIFFLASILIYPCFEITRSILLRSIKNTSLFNADNYHFHNYLNYYILNYISSKHIANSLTGISIALLSTYLPVSLYFLGISIISDLWLIIFGLQFFLLVFTYIFFKKKSSRLYK